MIRTVVRRVVAPLSRTKLFRTVGPVIMPPLERVTRALSGGRVQLAGLIVPSLVLHTVGARTGEPRDAYLMYTPDGRGRALVAGSNFAGERHPAWTNNLIAHPLAAITVRSQRVRVRATRVPDDELDATWAWLERQWPGYRQYERTSGRTVRIFVLQPLR